MFNFLSPFGIFPIFITRMTWHLTFAADYTINNDHYNIQKFSIKKTRLFENQRERETENEREEENMEVNYGPMI